MKPDFSMIIGRVMIIVTALVATILLLDGDFKGFVIAILAGTLLTMATISVLNK